MTRFAFDKHPSTVHKTSGIPSANSVGKTRACLSLVALIAGLLCLYAGTVYFSAARAQATVETWFSGEALPTRADIQTAQQALADAENILPGDADIKIALAKLNIVRAQKESANNYFKVAQTFITEARQLRPTHFEALALRVFLTDLLGQNDEAVVSLERLLNIAPFETQVQMLVGPILIKKWYTLPDSVQATGKKLITSALREPSTREAMLSAMGKYKVAAPFTCCSPNRETSARLRILEAEAANATYQ